MGADGVLNHAVAYKNGDYRTPSVSHKKFCSHSGAVRASLPSLSQELSRFAHFGEALVSLDAAILPPKLAGSVRGVILCFRTTYT